MRCLLHIARNYMLEKTTIRNKVPMRPPLLDDGRTELDAVEREDPWYSLHACRDSVIVVLHRSTGDVGVN